VDLLPLALEALNDADGRPTALTVALRLARAVEQLLIREQFGPSGSAQGSIIRMTPDLIVRQSTGPV